jgi:hypothetical protein
LTEIYSSQQTGLVRPEQITLQILRSLKRKRTGHTVSRTLRLNAEVDQRLVDLSYKERTSVNILANKALLKLVEWDSRTQELGFATLRKKTLRMLWDSLGADKARDMGQKAGGPEAVELIIFWFKSFNFENALKTVSLFGAEYGNLYRFQHDFDGKVHTLIVNHDLGKNFSLYLSGMFAETLKLLDADFDVTESERQILIRITT